MGSGMYQKKGKRRRGGSRREGGGGGTHGPGERTVGVDAVQRLGSVDPAVVHSNVGQKKSAGNSPSIDQPSTVIIPAIISPLAETLSE